MNRRFRRYWKYFRDGYHIYLTLPIGILNVATIIYYILGEQVPAIQAVFPRFTIFLVACASLGVPVAVTLGWIHNKKGILASEQEIAMENNPVTIRQNIVGMEFSLAMAKTLHIEPSPAFMRQYEFWKKAQQRLEKAR